MFCKHWTKKSKYNLLGEISARSTGLALTLLTLGVGVAWGQTLGIYTFTGSSTGNNQFNSVTSQPSGAAFSAITRVGCNWVSSSSNVFASNNFDASFNNSKYITFTITPSNFMALNEISWKMSRSGNSGEWAIRSSLDNYVSNINSGSISSSLAGVDRVLLPSAFQNLNIPVTFRIYAFNLQNAGGQNAATSRVVTIDDLIIAGKTCASGNCLSYVRPVATSTDDYINNFTTNGGSVNINNSNSGFSAPGYGDFTDKIVSRSAGETVDFSLTAGVTSWTYGVSIWVDWNTNGVFESNEKVFNNNGNWVFTPYSGSFVCPVSASMGDYAMRVAIDYVGTGVNMIPHEFIEGGRGNNQGRYGEAEDYTLRITATALPVELTSFTSECQKNDVEVKWSTASEHNSQYFILQVSQEGVNWSDLEKLDAAGFSNMIVDYAYVHKGAARTNSYYRLIQFDNDGATKTYSTIMTNCASDEAVFMTFPNPSKDAFTVVVNDELLIGTNVLNISDASGKLIYSIAVELENGSGSFALDDLDLPEGLYYLQLNNGLYASRIIKHSFR